MHNAPTFLRSGLSCYLFIYLVRDDSSASVSRMSSLPAADGVAAASRYCTVLAFGRTLESAERIAINRVHQQGLHIVRADTATAAPWLEPGQDGQYLDELASYGCALRLDAAGPTGTSATAA